MTNINIKIQKKDLWFLSAIMVFLIAVGYVVAYGGSQPISMGHTIGELDGVQARVTNGMTACSAGNSIRTINPDTGAVTCEADDNTVSGLITGGGVCGEGTYSDSSWGTGSCAGSTPVCTSGNTARQTGYVPGTDSWANYFICVRN